MKKCLCIMLCVAISVCNSYAAESKAASSNVAIHKSDNTVRHRGSGPAVIKGAAKNTGNISGTSVSPKR